MFRPPATTACAAAVDGTASRTPPVVVAAPGHRPPIFIMLAFAQQCEAGAHKGAAFLLQKLKDGSLNTGLGPVMILQRTFVD